MECVAPTAQEWRESCPTWTDDNLADELVRAWKMGKSFVGEPYEWSHHDWTNFRTATLREARRRHLDLSVVPARTLGL